MNDKEGTHDSLVQVLSKQLINGGNSYWDGDPGRSRLKGGSSRFV